MAPIKDHKTNTKPYPAVALFKNLTIFAELHDKDIALFTNAAQTKTYKKGQMLYREDEPAHSFYIICDGWVKLFRTTEEGEEVNLAMLTYNSITGENAIFEQGRFASSALVVEAAQIMSVPLALLKEQLKVNNQLALNMLASMVQYQRRHELQLEQYLLYSAPQRIGCFLIGLCPKPEQKDGIVLNLPYEKALIASTLGMKGATFSRALNILREETGIRISGTRVTIDSMDKLLEFVDGCYSHLHFIC